MISEQMVESCEAPSGISDDLYVQLAANHLSCPFVLLVVEVQVKPNDGSRGLHTLTEPNRYHFSPCIYLTENMLPELFTVASIGFAAYRAWQYIKYISS